MSINPVSDGMPRSTPLGETTQLGDPMAVLAATIKEAGQARDRTDQRRRDEQSAKERQREQGKVVWANLKPSIGPLVAKIDRMLIDSGFLGLGMVANDIKHNDLDRIIIEFEHAPHDHSKILLSVTRAGEFTCGVAPGYEEVEKLRLPIADVTIADIERALAHAVTQCITRKRMQ